MLYGCGATLATSSSNISDAVAARLGWGGAIASMSLRAIRMRCHMLHVSRRSRSRCNWHSQVEGYKIQQQHLLPNLCSASTSSCGSTAQGRQHVRTATLCSQSLWQTTSWRSKENPPSRSSRWIVRHQGQEPQGFENTADQ